MTSQIITEGQYRYVTVQSAEDFLPIHYLFKGKIAHIVSGSLTIYTPLWCYLTDSAAISPLPARVTLLTEIMI